MLTARIKAHLVGVGVCLVTACLMIVTEPSFSIVWDEGFTLGREESLRDWFEALRDPARFAATWQRRPLDDELVQRPPGTPPPRPEQMDTRRNSSLTATSWRGSGHSHARSRTDIRLSTPCSVSSAISLPQHGRSYPEPGWGRCSFSV